MLLRAYTVVVMRAVRSFVIILFVELVRQCYTVAVARLLMLSGRGFVR